MELSVITTAALRCAHVLSLSMVESNANATAAGRRTREDFNLTSHKADGQTAVCLFGEGSPAVSLRILCSACSVSTSAISAGREARKVA